MAKKCCKVLEGFGISLIKWFFFSFRGGSLPPCLPSTQTGVVKVRRKLYLLCEIKNKTGQIHSIMIPHLCSGLYICTYICMYVSYDTSARESRYENSLNH